MSVAVIDPTHRTWAPDSAIGGFPITYDAEAFDLTGKEAVFEIRLNADSEVCFRYRSGVDSQLEISGQTINFEIKPDTLSVELDENPTLAEALAGKRSIEWNIDIHTIGDPEVLRRIRGNFHIEPTHGNK